MYAIFDNGNKQYKASVGDTVKVEKLKAEVGATVNFHTVMTADDKGVVATGKEVENILVTAEVVSQGKDKKIIVFKYKSKKNERKKQGHRQPYTMVKITAIGDNTTPAPKKAKKSAPVAEEKPAVEVVEAPKAKKATAKKPAAKTEATEAKKPAAKKTTAKKTESKAK